MSEYYGWVAVIHNSERTGKAYASIQHGRNNGSVDEARKELFDANDRDSWIADVNRPAHIGGKSGSVRVPNLDVRVTCFDRFCLDVEKFINRRMK